MRRKFCMMRYHAKAEWGKKLVLWHAYLKSQFLYGMSAVFPFISKSKQLQIQRFTTTTLKGALGIVLQSRNKEIMAMTNQWPI